MKKVDLTVKEKQLKSVQLVNSCLQTSSNASRGQMRIVQTERNCNLGKLKYENEI